MNNASFQSPFMMQPSYGSPFAQMNQQQLMPSLPNTQLSQQAQAAQQMQASLLGRYVSNADEIMPQEVSMGNAPSFFPLLDGSAVIAKQWANDGKINTVRYVAEAPSDGAVDAESSVSLVDVMNTLNSMQDAIEALKKSVDKKPATTAKRTAPKKEAIEDDSD